MSIEKRTLDSGDVRWRVRYRGLDNRERAKTFRRKIDAQAFEASQLTSETGWLLAQPRSRKGHIPRCDRALAHGELVLGNTKTHQRRSVPLPRSCFVRRRRSQSVCPRFAGRCVSRNFCQRIFKPAVERAAIGRHVRFHDLRHTCAALLISQGAHPRALMERLGHCGAFGKLSRTFRGLLRPAARCEGSKTAPLLVGLIGQVSNHVA